MKYITIILQLLFFVLYINSSFAKQLERKILLHSTQQTEKHKNKTIGKIVIIGNEKTQYSVIKDCLNIKEGDPFNAFNYDLAMQNLYKTRLFKSVDMYFFDIQDATIELHVEVDEKVTLIPIPMILYTPESYTFGFFLMEANFLGYNKKLMVGGIYSDTGWNSMIMFEDPGENKNSFIYNLMYRIGENKIENTDMEDTRAYQKFKSFDNLVAIDLGLKFLYKNRIYLRNGLRTASIDEDYDKNLMPPESASYYLTGVNYLYENMNYTQHFKTGFESRIQYLRGFTLNDKNHDYHHVQFSALYQLDPWLDHLISFKVNSGAGDLPATIEDRIGGRDCFKSLPSKKISADYYTGSTVSYEIPFYRSGTFIFTDVIFYETGWFKRIDVDDHYFNGVGNGLRMYLKKVAIPAIGLDAAYSITTGNLELSLSIGLRL